ncbi:MAG: Fe-S protein assembly co-chaperone HscB [Pseudomonadota bacterium]
MQFTHQNYFQVFALPETFAVDSDALNRAYRALQEQVHPDRVASGAGAEKLAAVQLSSWLNEAYETLRFPIKRAAYLLEIKGIDSNKVDQSELDPGLLLEQIEWRERLAELPRNDSALGELERLRTEVVGRQDSAYSEFAAALEQARLAQAKKCFHELQYLHKLLQEVDALEEDLLGY